jgi:hypothetical protein
VGTLKLSGTTQEVTVEQAKELVMYWQVYQELRQSDTAAQAEIDALVAQIQERMTSDQMAAIAEMNITQQDEFASMQGAMVTSSSASASPVSLPSASAGGGMPSGGGPPDGGGVPIDLGGGAPISGTRQTRSSGAGAGLAVTTRVPSALVKAVIQALQQKIAA